MRYALGVIGKEIDVHRFLDLLRKIHPFKIMGDRPIPTGFEGEISTPDNIDFGEIEKCCDECGRRVQAMLSSPRTE